MKTFLKYTIIVLFFGSNIPVLKAQEREVAIFQLFQKDEEFNDNAFLNIGITFNYDYINYVIKKKPNSYAYTNIQSISGGSLGVGIPAILQLNHTVDLYSGIGFNFNMSNPVNSSKGYGIAFDNDDGRVIKRHFDNNPEGSNFINMEIPLGLRIRSNTFYFDSNPYNSYRILLIGGTNFYRHFSAKVQAKDLKNVIKNQNITDHEYLLFKPNFFSWEAGAGIQITTRYFRVTPQLTFKESFGNLLDTKKYLKWQDENISPSPNMNALRSLGIRGFQFKIILE